MIKDKVRNGTFATSLFSKEKLTSLFLRKITSFRLLFCKARERKKRNATWIKLKTGLFPALCIGLNTAIHSGSLQLGQALK